MDRVETDEELVAVRAAERSEDPLWNKVWPFGSPHGTRIRKPSAADASQEMNSLPLLLPTTPRLLLFPALDKRGFVFALHQVFAESLTSADLVLSGIHVVVLLIPRV
jgi:hypothetical protein